MEKHYVCLGCGGVSDKPKNCETEGCQLHGQPLRECTCTDGTHTAILSQGI